jgi:hypothetical protein
VNTFAISFIRTMCVTFGRWRWRVWFLSFSILTLVSAATASEPPPRKHTNIERLSLVRLAAVHDDVLKLNAQRRNIPSLPGLNDYRCILHAHAEDSTHTGGTLLEMLGDAKQAGVSAILLTDHYRPPRDFIDGRWRGMRNGVLFIPGSEARGFLVYPMQSVLTQMEVPDAEFVKTVAGGGGMIFLSHIEERKDHSLDGLTGLEIYNRHWDAKQDMPSLFGRRDEAYRPQATGQPSKSPAHIPG